MAFRDNVVKAAYSQKGKKAIHCWDAVARMYAAAGVYQHMGYQGHRRDCYTKRPRTCWFNKHIVNAFAFKRGGPDSMGNPGKLGPNPFLPDSDYDKILPGDWLYIHNRNDLDNYGNHSIFFVKWEDKSKRICRALEQRRAMAGIKEYSDRSLYFSLVVGWMQPKETNPSPRAGGYTIDW